MSSEKNIIKVYFKGTHLTHSKTQYQYNHGMVLHFADLNLPQAFETHFANKQHGNSKTVIGSENKVEIPDEYFWTGANEIFAWVYLHSDVDDGETVYEVRIPLVKRAKPSDEEPLPEQQSAIDRAIAELSHAVETTNADVEQTSADREAVTTLRDEVIDLRDEAEQSAQTATAKANEANESANSASESEQNAHDYADDAKRYAENAFSSKETAVASASDAEQAKEDAEQARDDAQNAKSDAIQIKQDVVGLKDDVTNLKDDVVNLKNDVIGLKEQTDTNVTHYPKIVDEYWHVWDATQNDFVNTGVDAEGEKGDKGDKGDTYILTEQDKQDIANLVEVPESFEIHICSSAEYDSTTRIPTIQNPDERTFYLVPSEDGTSPDLFTEWVYVNGAWEMFGSMKIDLSGYLTDVTVGGNSVVTNGVAEIPVASRLHLGAVKVDSDIAHSGLSVDNTTGFLELAPAIASVIKNGSNSHMAISPSRQHEATFYGLAKASGDTTQSQSANAVGTYTDEAKTSIQNMLGVPSVDDIPDVPVEDVQIDGTSILSDGVAEIPFADTTNPGVSCVNSIYGIGSFPNGHCLYIYAPTSSYIKSGTNSYRPIVPKIQHESAFYGLAKAAGDTTQSQSSNAVGMYTEEAKTAIRTMLGLDTASLVAEIKDALGI